MARVQGRCWVCLRRGSRSRARGRCRAASTLLPTVPLSLLMVLGAARFMPPPPCFVCAVGRRSYYHNAKSGVVQWDRPVGAEVRDVSHAAAAASANNEQPVKRHWLQNVGSDGLPDQAPQPKQSFDPGSSPLMRVVERVHYYLVHSREVSLGLVAVFVIALGVASYVERRKEALRRIEAERSKAERVARTGPANANPPAHS